MNARIIVFVITPPSMTTIFVFIRQVYLTFRPLIFYFRIKVNTLTSLYNSWFDQSHPDNFCTVQLLMSRLDLTRLIVRFGYLSFSPSPWVVEYGKISSHYGSYLLSTYRLNIF